MLPAEIIRDLRGVEAEKNIVFCLLYYHKYASVMLSLYAQLSSHELAIRERAAVNMQVLGSGNLHDFNRWYCHQSQLTQYSVNRVLIILC